MTTPEPTTLILGDDRLDRWQFRDLMPPGLRIRPLKRLLAAPAMGRNQGNHFLTLLRWDQGPSVSRVARLPTLLSGAFGFVGFRFRVRMHGTRRKRRILRIGFLDGNGQGLSGSHRVGQLINLNQKRFNELASLAGQLRVDLWWDAITRRSRLGFGKGGSFRHAPSIDTPRTRQVTTRRIPRLVNGCASC